MLMAATTALITLAAMLTPLTAADAAVTTLPTADGLSEATAAASCWERAYKRAVPAPNDDRSASYTSVCWALTFAVV